MRDTGDEERGSQKQAPSQESNSAFDDTFVRHRTDSVEETLDGRFTLLGRLGSGGMGTVYRAQRLDSVGEHVAIKVLHGRTGEDRFENEARALFNLKHPHVCRPIELGRTRDGRPFLVMEHLEGEPMSAAIDAGRLTESDILRIGVEVCGALAEAHAKGLIHRDLKPANIFLQRVGQEEITKVLDFGVARILDDADGREVTMVAHHEPTQGLVGSLPYMSPEQARAEPATTASDLFALGLVLHVGLTGRHAYHYSNHDPRAILLAHAMARPEPHAFDIQGRPLRRELVAILDHLLAFEPDRRPLSAAEVGTHLQTLRAPQTRPGVEPSHAPDEVPPRPRVRRPRLGPIVVPGLTALAVIAVLVGLRGSRVPGLTEKGQSTVATSTMASSTPPRRADAGVAPKRSAPDAGRRLRAPTWRLEACSEHISGLTRSEAKREMTVFLIPIRRCLARYAGGASAVGLRLSKTDAGVTLTVDNEATRKVQLDRCLERVAKRQEGVAYRRIYVACNFRRRG